MYLMTFVTRLKNIKSKFADEIKSIKNESLIW